MPSSGGKGGLKKGKATTLVEKKVWRDERVFSEIEDPHEEYIGILAERFNHVYNEVDVELGEFKSCFRIALQAAKDEITSIVNVEKISKAQQVVDKLFVQMTPFVVRMAHSLEYHLASTKADVLLYKKFYHMQSTVKRKILFHAWRTWSGIIFEDRERVLYQMSRPACKMLVAKINHKMLKYAFRKWAVVWKTYGDMTRKAQAQAKAGGKDRPETARN
mmetsp:Transcript_30284/g.58216  ORF Transcript_30284/g.58216 Transcript_30284/m.58216 type:complete len:218 (+) Transcript_30284:330-983(+)|eukprot:CAMPEP_0114234728 /NCGR_PEP_ID=MMETSP0058-20121206/5863_1 /TAXON_ID=36894 /ORGANISM="Pyramimonas parkeae, CCMP726" /LENGTH=217 /DNA_ID=CAMNT_0001346425 /DNA_START=318 /DNA_END=971 /DNA_ORIENTATION=-